MGPLKDALPFPWVWLGSQQPPCADRSELRFIPEAGPRPARYCSVCGREARDICGSALEQREFTQSSFLGYGAGWRTV